MMSSESDREPRSFLPKSPIGALPHHPSPARSYYGMFRREPANSGFDWTFTPRRRSKERFAYQHPYGPPRSFRHASSCPRLDHPVSGRIQVITRKKRRVLPKKAAHLLVSLRPRLNDLALPLEYTPWPVLQNVRHNPGHLPSYLSLTRNSFEKNLSFWAMPHYNRLVLGTFHLLFKGAFQFSLTVLLHYRFWDVFSLGG